jgi:hypothetical protein
VDSRYYPSFEVAKMVGLSSKAISKITSRFMAVNGDGHKTNLGLNLKFEAKGQKVIDYSRKNERFWEFSEKTVELIREYKVARFLYCISCSNFVLTGKVPRSHATVGEVW